MRTLDLASLADEPGERSAKVDLTPADLKRHGPAELVVTSVEYGTPPTDPIVTPIDTTGYCTCGKRRFSIAPPESVVIIRRMVYTPPVIKTPPDFRSPLPELLPHCQTCGRRTSAYPGPDPERCFDCGKTATS